MWPQLEKYLPEFSSAVLSGLDSAGDLYSLLCRPMLVPAQQWLQVALPAAVPLQPGPACLLCHAHDDHLWNLKSFVVRGELARLGAVGAWGLRPWQFIPGMGIGGWRSYIQFVRHGRAATRRYFARRGQPQPPVDWDDLMALFTGAPASTT